MLRSARRSRLEMSHRFKHGMQNRRNADLEIEPTVTQEAKHRFKFLLHFWTRKMLQLLGEDVELHAVRPALLADFVLHKDCLKNMQKDENHCI